MLARLERAHKGLQRKARCELGALRTPAKQTVLRLVKRICARCDRCDLQLRASSRPMPVLRQLLTLLACCAFELTVSIIQQLSDKAAGRSGGTALGRRGNSDGPRRSGHAPVLLCGTVDRRDCDAAGSASGTKSNDRHQVCHLWRIYPRPDGAMAWTAALPSPAHVRSCDVH